MKKGSPAFGLVLGLCFAGAAALVMVIGFWRVLILAVLFGIGYFLGTVENKEAFLKDTVNKILPRKNDEVIDIKSEITREQQQRTDTRPASEESDE